MKKIMKKICPTNQPAKLRGTFAIKNLRKKGRRTFMYIFEVKNLIKTYNLRIN